MDPREVAASWRRAFGDVAPVGFACREVLRDRWLRIHSLPGSKRYPKDGPEYAELLRRHNEVATGTLGAQGSCVLFVGQFARSPGVPEATDLPSVDTGRWVGIAELSASLDEEEGDDWIRVAAMPVRWQSGRFDTLIRAAAEDKTGPLLFANLDIAQAYAPYDGGADLFFNTSESVEAMRARWSDWLSSRRDGL